MNNYKLSLLVILCSLSSCLSKVYEKPGVCDDVDPSRVVAKAVDGTCVDYILCTNGTKTTHQCSHGLWFDPDRQTCDFPGPYCSEANYKPTDGFSKIADGPDPRCVDDSLHYYPHALYCDWYIECYHGFSYDMTCPTGLFFSYVRQACGYAGESECCALSAQC